MARGAKDPEDGFARCLGFAREITAAAAQSDVGFAATAPTQQAPVPTVGLPMVAHARCNPEYVGAVEYPPGSACMVPGGTADTVNGTLWCNKRFTVAGLGCQATRLDPWSQAAQNG